MENQPLHPFALQREDDVEIAVFDLAGRRVATLFRGPTTAGLHTARWNGRYDDGRPAPAGVYHAALSTTDGRVTRNFVLAR